MKAAIYARVSTEDQGKEGTSLDSQKLACLEKAAGLGYVVDQENIYVETRSGLTLDRPELTKLRTIAKNQAFQAIVVYTPDRLCRVGEDILMLFREFKSSGIKLIFVKQQWDDNLNGKLLGFILGWSSEFEAEQIKERTMRGKKTLVLRGVLPQGTGKGLYGYSWDRASKKRIIQPFESEVVKNIFQMVADGDSYISIANKLNSQNIPTKSQGKWHPLTIKRIVSNTAYIGKTYFGKTKRVGKTKVIPTAESEWSLLKDVTPILISKELFELAQEALAKPRARTGKAAHEYLLTGFLTCGKCGNPMVGSCLGRKYRYYSCTGKNATTSRPRVCNASYVNADQLEDIIWSRVRKIFENPENILAEIHRQVKAVETTGTDVRAVADEIARLRASLLRLELQEKRLLSLFRYEEIGEDQLLDQINSIKADKAVIEQHIIDLQSIKQRQVNLTDAEVRLEEFQRLVHKRLSEFTAEDKRGVFHAIQLKAIVANGEVEVKGIIPQNLITIEQTSALPRVHSCRCRWGPGRPGLKESLSPVPPVSALARRGRQRDSRHFIPKHAGV